MMIIKAIRASRGWPLYAGVGVIIAVGLYTTPYIGTTGGILCIGYITNP